MNLDQKKLSINRLESLPNELFYDIFEYLDGCHADEAFKNLNTRFQSLVSTTRSLMINFDEASKTTFEDRCKHLVALKKNNIISLSMSNPLAIDRFFELFQMDSTFARLESLVLNNIRSTKLMTILTNLITLPRLVSLTMTIIDRSIVFNNIYDLIFRLPTLKYGKFSFVSPSRRSIVPKPAEEQCSNIEELILDDYCRLDELNTYLSYAPRLRRLKCQHLTEPKSGFLTNSLIQLPDLTHLTIDSCDLSFDKFTSFLSNISIQLRVLRFMVKFDPSYLDADQWEQFICQHLINLKIFDFEHWTDLIYDDNQANVYRTRINRFTSSFWINQKWFFEHKHESISTIFYSTRSFKNKMYELYKRSKSGHNLARHVMLHNQKEIAKSSVQFPQATEVTLMPEFVSDICSMVDDLNRIVPLVQITRLNINCGIGVDTLLELVRRSPNLDALKLPIYGLTQSKNLDATRAETIRMILNTNKITKVSFSEICDCEQVLYFTQLCSRLEYVNAFVTSSSLEQMIQKLVLNPHLRSLCLGLKPPHTISKQTVESLINREKLLDNYSIEEIDDTIYLWW